MIVLKILVAPFVVALTLLVAIVSFLYGPGTAAGCRCALLSDPPVLQAGRDHPGGGKQGGL